MNKHVLAAVVLCVPAGLLAWQGGMAAVDVTEAALQTQLERVTRQKGDGLTLSIVGPKQVALAMALSPAEQAVLMKELGAAAKAIVMSPAFQSAHEAYIAKEYHAIDHGLKVTSLEQAATAATTQAGATEIELKMKREMAAVFVQMAMETKMPDLKMMFDASLQEWAAEAAKAKGSDKAKYTKLVAGAQPIKDLSASDPDKFRRGYAVLRSAEADGLDTEAALFGAQASSQKDSEQLMWDKRN